MNLKIPQPHDSFIKLCLADKEVAQDMIRTCISIDFAEQVDWDTLEQTNNSFIKEELSQLHSDLLFRFQLKGEKIYNFLLLEHQSTPDKFLPFRIMNYDISIMNSHLKRIKK